MVSHFVYSKVDLIFNFSKIIDIKYVDLFHTKNTFSPLGIKVMKCLLRFLETLKRGII